MGNVRPLIKSIFVRLVMAVPIFLYGFATYSQETYGGALGACVCFVIAGALIAFPLSRLLAEPSGKFYWCGEQFDRPQPIYSIPQARRARGLYEEAIAGLEAIALEYPEEVRPHADIIDIVIRDLKDTHRARACYDRALASLKKPESKAELKRKFKAQEPWLMRLTTP